MNGSARIQLAYAHGKTDISHLGPKIPGNGVLRVVQVMIGKGVISEVEA